MIYENKDQLKGCESILAYDGGDIRVLYESRFREKLIDDSQSFQQKEIC